MFDNIPSQSSYLRDVYTNFKTQYNSCRDTLDDGNKYEILERLFGIQRQVGIAQTNAGLNRISATDRDAMQAKLNKLSSKIEATINLILNNNPDNQQPLQLTPELENLIARITSAVAQGANENEVSVILQSQLAREAFTIKDQELAKIAFQKAMRDVLGSEVIFVSPAGIHPGVNARPSLQGPLKEYFVMPNMTSWDREIENFEFRLPDEIKQIVSWERTDGVQYDILKASYDEQAMHLFSVASQYNCAEASGDWTPPKGQAMARSEHDWTQGPLAQRTNPIAFELVTAFLTHLGFNMMDKALPESVGKTYPTEEVKARQDGKTTILNGYLQPAGWFYNASETKQQAAQQNLKEVVDYLESHIGSFETVCYSSTPQNGGNNPVCLILAAAPNISAPFYGPEVSRLEYLSARANLTTQLQQVIHLSNLHPQKDIVLHATMPGLGVFGNHPVNFAKAAADSIMEFYEQLTDRQKEQIKIKFSVYIGDGQGEAAKKALQVIKGLALNEL